MECKTNIQGFVNYMQKKNNEVRTLTEYTLGSEFRIIRWINSVHPDILQADKNLCITILNVGTAL
jgi:hypothetical protein